MLVVVEVVEEEIGPSAVAITELACIRTRVISGPSRPLSAAV